MKELKAFTAPLARNPDLTKLWLGQMLSQIGTKMFQIAVVWWFVSQFEGKSGSLIGWFLIFGVAPGVLFVKWIGQFVERHPLRSMIVRSDLVALAFCLLLLIPLYFDIYHVGLFFAASFALSLCQSVIDPAVNKFLPKITKPEDLTFGISLISSSQTFASFLGALCGATAVATFGMTGALCFNALSYAASYFLCSKISIESQGSEDIASAEGPGKGLGDVIRRHSFYVVVLAVFAMINLFLTPILVTMPVYIKRVFDGSAYLLATMEALLWAGMLLGAFATNFLKSTADTLLVGAYSLLAVGISLLFGGMSEHVWLYAASMLPIGAALGLMNVKFMSMFQQVVPDQDKGRFFALLMAVINFLTPIGFLGFGVLVDQYSVVSLTVLQGVGVIAIALSFVVLRRWRPQS